MVVETFGDQILYNNERASTHISPVLSFLAIIEGVGYEVHRYNTTSTLPYGEWSNKWRWMDDAEW
jgi:hypothetical protein